MPTFYLSSTYEDLKDYRYAVSEALRKSGYQVIAMEEYVATDRRPVEKCLQDVEKADCYIGLFGFRYGYVPPPEHNNPNGLSITELEFRHAESCNKPCLAFMAKEDPGMPLRFVDAYTGKGGKGKQIERLRKDLLREKTVDQFQSPDELVGLVLPAVTKLIEENQTLELSLSESKSKGIEWPNGKSPYPGLEWFDENYAPLYFGRDREVDDVVAKMNEPEGRFLLISGASGSGKSSLVAAGLWHALIKEGRLPGSKKWRWLRLTPGGDGRGPLESLASGLKQAFPKIPTRADDLATSLAKNTTTIGVLLATHLSTDQEVLLFVDQLEELYTQGFKDEDIQRFLKELVDTARDPQNRVRVVATVRSEFIGKLEESETVLKVLNTGYNYHLGPVSPGILQEMIERPAQATGYVFEPQQPQLVDEILDEAGKEPGNLPLVAYTLKQLFVRRQGKMFTRETFHAMGGVAGAIGTKADQVMETLGAAAVASFDKVFAELVHLDRDRPPTRKRVLLANFADDAGATTLIQALAGQDCRVLVTGGEAKAASVEVAHEKLFSSWKKLQTWIDDSGEDLRLIDFEEEAAKRWHETGGHLQNLMRFAGREEKIQKALNRFSKNPSPMLEQMLRPQPMLIARLEDDALSHEDRLLIGKKLAEFGDQRPGVGLREDGVPDIEWVEIPAGHIRLEDVDHVFEVKRFRMAKYPVTNVQFESFINAEDGYRQKEWWTGIPHSEAPESIDWDEPNCPRSKVSWVEAVAFCRWLSHRLGSIVRLPTEWEWQQAATEGKPAYDYPWGKDWDTARCNSVESRLSRSTAVGLYPRGVTPNGVLDMTGNVWEWCLNKPDHPEKPESVNIDDDDWRALRGGCWQSSSEFLRTSFRKRSFVEFQVSGFGFRLAQDIP